MNVCIYYTPFVFIKIIFYITYTFFNEQNVREITLLQNPKGDSPLKRSGHVLIQIILLHGFGVCISILSIVRLNRYVIQIILLHGFGVCISIVSIVRLNRYVIEYNKEFNVHI